MSVADAGRLHSHNAPLRRGRSIASVVFPAALTGAGEGWGAAGGIGRDVHVCMHARGGWRAGASPG